MANIVAFKIDFAGNDTFQSLLNTDDTDTGKGWSLKLLSDLVVDLGLSVKWAYWNLGTTEEKDENKEEERKRREKEIGDYFAWGENSGYLNGKKKFSFGTYYWMTEEGREAGDYAKGNQITKYTWADDEKDCIWYSGNTFIGDGKASLQEYDKADDAAYAALGGKFRMPTAKDWADLKENCTWVWQSATEAGNDYGGVWVSRNGNSIFLPVAYLMSSRGFDTTGSEKGIGWYWSSSLTDDSCWATCMSFGVDMNEVITNIPSSYRSAGLSIRPVYDPNMP